MSEAPLSHVRAVELAKAVLLEAPLYLAQDLPLSVKRLLLYDGFAFDAHCVHCRAAAPFVVERDTIKTSDLEQWLTKPRIAHVEAQCRRNSSHTYRYWLRVSQNTVSKVGQTPSLEDIAGADIEKYRSQLKGGAFAELKRATGLVSHGVGIGAFVYLRRIFERLIHEHHAQIVANGGAIASFATMRMDEKISALREVLPPSLVTNAATYSILSKGLHELSEDECKLYFPVVKAAIILMLEEDWLQRERRKAADELQRQIQDISGKLRTKSSEASDA